MYNFNRVVFGVSSSPFLAHIVAQENARGTALCIQELRRRCWSQLTWTTAWIRYLQRETASRGITISQLSERKLECCHGGDYRTHPKFCQRPQRKIVPNTWTCRLHRCLQSKGWAFCGKQVMTRSLSTSTGSQFKTMRLRNDSPSSHCLSVQLVGLRQAVCRTKQDSHAVATDIRL